MAAFAESGSPRARWRRRLELAAKAASELQFLVGETLYACCNLSFNERGAATDANYLYLSFGGNTIPFGSRVTVERVFLNHIEFQRDGSDRIYALWFKFGTNRLTAKQYFQNVLRTEDPKERLRHVAPAIVHAIEDGQLIVGMTREQALMARGYPPFHQTPGVASDSWLYYRSPGKGQMVEFSDGRIRLVREGAAP